MTNALTVKKVYRGNGKKGKSIFWYANSNNREASGITVGAFLNANSSSSKHCYSKNQIKKLFLNYKLKFEE